MDQSSTNTQQSLKALALVCSLRPSPSESSSDLLVCQVLEEMKQYNVDSTVLRVADYTIKPGVATDMGDGDDWPKIRQQMLDADIFIIATPTWVGHMSSIAMSIVERLDAEISETDDAGRMMTYGKVGGVVVVGNEDGAHKICGDLFQVLSDVGFSLPAGAATYWNGEAMNKVDYKDLDKTPDAVATTNKSMAANIVHLARLLKTKPYPPVN